MGIGKVQDLFKIIEDDLIQLFVLSRIKEQVDLTLSLHDKGQYVSCRMPVDEWIAVIGFFIKFISASPDTFFLSAYQALEVNLIPAHIIGNICNRVPIRAKHRPGIYKIVFYFVLNNFSRKVTARLIGTVLFHVIAFPFNDQVAE